MKNLRSTLLIAGMLGLAATTATAQRPMMGQANPESTPQSSYGPGAMGGRGMMGPGMMGQYGGMGPGMMGGYGSMGPGMMGPYGGMGPGMMGEYGGPCMMGPGGGYGPAPWANLSQEQRQQLADIQNQLLQKQQPLQQQLQQRSLELYNLSVQPDAVPKAVGEKYAQVFELRQQMAKNIQEAQEQMQQIFSKQG